MTVSMPAVRAAAILFAVALSATLLTPEVATAQVQRYQPQRATVSPYLNLSRINNGAVPNYYSLVRPQLQQEAFNARELAFNRRQAGALRQLSSTVERRTEALAPTGTAGGFFTPSQQYRFLETTGYYPQPTAPQRPR